MSLSLRNDVLSALAEKVAFGLQRKAINTCSKWCEKYRVMGQPVPGPWRWDYHPWLLEMHDCEADKIVGKKAAQMGFTEWAINTAFFNMDVNGYNVLYLLPTTDDASDFTTARFDPALQASEYLRDFFSDVNNVALKRAGENILYVRGVRSRSKLKSIPTPIVIFDELEEMPKGVLALAGQRQAGQKVEKSLMLSTPFLENSGIDAEYKLSSENHFFFRCPSCSKLVELTWPESIILVGDSLLDPRIKESHYICTECKVTLPHETKIEWLKHKKLGGTAHYVPAHTDRDAEGFHVSQMYSMMPAGHPSRFAEFHFRSQTDPSYGQELFNSKLGQTYEAPGARISEQQVEDAIGGYYKGPAWKQLPITMGVDVGSVLHIVIVEWTRVGNFISVNECCTGRVLYEDTSSGTSTDFNEAYDLFKQYGCWAGVVDSEPERRAAMQFCQRLYGRMLMCDYLFSQQGREAQYDEEAMTLKVNRTSWLDMSLGRFRNGSIKIPADSSLAFKRQIREPVRVQREDKYKNKYGVYVNVNDDHFAHALNYAEIALPFAYSLADNQDIRTLYI